MKNLKQIREQFDLITEKEEKEGQKLSALVRAGLYDAKKLPALKKALEKSADKMTSQEKRMLLNLLDSLISQVVSDDQVYRKVRQNVHNVNEAKMDTYSKFDPRYKAGYPTDKEMPSVLILKRKAIRVYPDNQKVALYYSQALDKYITIPYNDIQIGLDETEQRLYEYSAGDVAGDAADILLPGVSAYKNFKKGNYGAAAFDAALDVGGALASIPTLGGGWALRTGIKAGIKGAGRLAAKGTTKTAGKGLTKGSRLARLAIKAKRLAAAALASGGSGGRGSNSSTETPTKPNYNFTKKPELSTPTAVASNAALQKRDERSNRQAIAQQAMPTESNVLDTIKSIVENDISEQTIRFNENKITINNTVAKKLLNVYESVNKTNKKKMEQMLNESATSFNKVLTFAVRQ